MNSFIFEKAENKNVYIALEELHALGVSQQQLDSYIAIIDFINPLRGIFGYNTEQHYNHLLTALKICKSKNEELGWKEVIEKVMKELEKSKENFEEVMTIKVKLRAMKDKKKSLKRKKKEIKEEDEERIKKLFKQQEDDEDQVESRWDVLSQK